MGVLTPAPRWFSSVLGLAIGLAVGVIGFFPAVPTPEKQTHKLFRDDRKPAPVLKTATTARAPGAHRARQRQ